MIFYTLWRLRVSILYLSLTVEIPLSFFLKYSFRLSLSWKVLCFFEVPFLTPVTDFGGFAVFVGRVVVVHVCIFVFVKLI